MKAAVCTRDFTKQSSAPECGRAALALEPGCRLGKLLTVKETVKTLVEHRLKEKITCNKEYCL